MTEWTDITPEQYRCVGGACPSVHISEDGKTLRITGKHVPVNPETLYLVEVTLDISADLVREALLNQ